MAPNCSELLNDSSMSIFSTPTDPKAYIWLAVAHLLAIIIPACITVTVAYNLVSRLSGHPSKLIFKWICLLCLICPCTYAALMDASFIFDIPLLGNCEKRWQGAIYWLAHSSLETSLLWIFALNPAVFYISIIRKTTNYSAKKVNAILFGIVMLAFMESSLWVFLTESYVTTRCKVRGSFCLVVFEGAPPTAIIFLEYLRILIGVVPALVSVPLFVGLYVRKVKNSVRHFNPALSKSILNVCVALIVGAFLWNLPTMLLHFATYHGSQRTFVSLVTTYTLQLNYVLHPVLIITLHKDLRKSISKRFRRMFRIRCTGVHPTNDPGEPYLPFQPGSAGQHPPGNPQPHPPGNPQPHPPGNPQPHPPGNPQPHLPGNQQPHGDNQPAGRENQSENYSDDEWETAQEDWDPEDLKRGQPHPPEDKTKHPTEPHLPDDYLEWETAQEDWDPAEADLKIDLPIEPHPPEDDKTKHPTESHPPDDYPTKPHPPDDCSIESHLPEGKTNDSTEPYQPEHIIGPFQLPHPPEGPLEQPHALEGTPKEPHPPEAKTGPLPQPHPPEAQPLPLEDTPKEPQAKTGPLQQPHPLEDTPKEPHPPEAETGPLQQPHPPEAKTGPLQQPHPPEAKAGPLQQPHPPEAKAGPLQQPHPPEAKAGPLQQPHPPEAKAGPLQQPHPLKAKAGPLEKEPRPPEGNTAEPHPPEAKVGPLKKPHPPDPEVKIEKPLNIN